jgi:hypothetical protein
MEQAGGWFPRHLRELQRHSPPSLAQRPGFLACSFFEFTVVRLCVRQQLWRETMKTLSTAFVLLGLLATASLADIRSEVNSYVGGGSRAASIRSGIFGGQDNIGYNNSGTGNIGAFNGGTGNIGGYNGNGNADATSGNNNVGAFNGNNNSGANNGNGNVGGANGNFNSGAGNGNRNRGFGNGNFNGGSLNGNDNFGHLNGNFNGNGNN